MAEGQGEDVDPYAYEDIDTNDYELYRIPPKIVVGIVSGLEKHGEFLRAWLQAASRSFPRRTLLDVLRNEPRAFPPFSGESESARDVQVRSGQDTVEESFCYVSFVLSCGLSRLVVEICMLFILAVFRIVAGSLTP